MNLKHIVTVLAAASIFTGSMSSIAQMRPHCFEDPDKPGACFVGTTPGGAINCGFPTAEGTISFFPIGDFNDNQFVRGNPKRDGRAFLHYSAKELAAGFCYWEDVLADNCADTSGPIPIPLEGAFLGTATLSSNGLINPETGGALCPFVSKARGMVSNINREEMLEIDAVLHLVPDGNGGCRLKECRILAPNQ